MSLLALMLLSFGLTDILWSISESNHKTKLQGVWQPLVGALATVAAVASLGVDGLDLALVAAGLFALTGAWSRIDTVDTPGRAWGLLGFFAVAALSALVAGGFVSSAGGWFTDWYQGWDWRLEDSASVDQFVFLVAALLFSTVSANRIVSSGSQVRRLSTEKSD